nr:hypothetical protein [Thermoflexales bacterium]
MRTRLPFFVQRLVLIGGLLAAILSPGVLQVQSALAIELAPESGGNAPTSTPIGDEGQPNAPTANVSVQNANDDGPGSLRQALLDVSAGDTITFNGDYAITLTSQLSVTQNVTLDGTG